MNKYEKRFLLLMNFTTWFGIATILANIVLPLSEKFKFTFFSVPQTVIIIIITITLMNVRNLIGSENGAMTLLPVIIFRGIEAWAFVYMLKDLTLQSFIVLLVFDVIHFVLIFSCKIKYEFEDLIEEANGDLIKITPEELEAQEFRYIGSREVE